MSEEKHLEKTKNFLLSLAKIVCLSISLTGHLINDILEYQKNALSIKTQLEISV